MKKSLLSLALAGSMLSALAVPAFAATPSDVVGKPVQTAVEELTALGIINGYEDGTFKPDNTITRAELAKIVIVATGNQSAANLMANTAPSFKDVKAGAWYTGYINAAAAKGFIQGYNGNFRPNDTIKFEEVTAILVRALGYKDKYLSGSWPYNVLLQADEVGLFEGVEMANGSNATRGVVAELTENSLGANLVQYDADGNVSNVQTSVTVNGTTTKVDQLLINKLGTSTTEVVTAVALNDDKQINLNGTPVGTAASFFIANGKKLADLLGHNVTVLKNKDGDVIAVADVQDANSIVTKTAASGTAFAANGTFTVDGTSYKATADAVVYKNSVKQPAGVTLNNDTEVQLIKNSAGNVQAVLVNEWSSNVALDEVIAYTNYSRVTAQTDSATAGNFKVDATTSITLDGKAATIADLKENDIINVLVDDNTKVATKLVATRNVVTGKVEAKGTDAGSATVKVGGTTYINVSGIAPTLGTEYTFYLNKNNEVAYIHAPNAVTASSYAVIYSVTPGSQYIDGTDVKTGTKVVYYSLKDQKVVTAYTTDTFTSNATNAADLKNNLIELKFDSNGLIALTQDDLDASVDAVTDTGTVSADPTASKLTVDTVAGTTTTTTNYITNSNTIYLKVGIDASDITKNTVTNATAADVAKTDTIVVKSANGVAQYVIVKTKGSAAATLPTAQGLFVSQSSVVTADGTTYSVKLNVNGEEKTYAIAAPVAPTAPATAVNKNDIVTLNDTDTSNSVYDASSAYATESATLTSVNNDAKTFVAGSTYLVTSNTQIVLLKKSDSTISQGSFADLRVAADGLNYGTDPGQYKVIVKASGDAYGGIDEAGVIIVVAY